MNIKKLDHFVIGLLAGILSPAIVLLLFYFIRYSGMGLGRFLKFIQMEGTLSPRISLCVIINLLLFYLFIWSNKYRSAKGIIFATFVYAGWVVYLKVF